MRAGSIRNGKYIGVRNGGILHTINYDTDSAVATMYGPRVTVSLLGDGYVEAVSDAEFREISRDQAKMTKGKVQGEVVYLSLAGSSDDHKVVGRFGWKAQHASLLDASADALLHELGVPNPIFFADAGSIQRNEGSAAEPSSSSSLKFVELEEMVAFIRSTQPPTPDHLRSSTPEAKAGSRIFDRVGCSLCHVRTLTTASPGTRMKASNTVISERLGNKKIHPFSDYLLHDIGTGDGIVQYVRPEDYAQSTANKFRTAPLWGLRFRLWMMHDGRSLTYHQAIMRHRGEAFSITLRYSQLSPAEKEELLQFLDSL